MPVCNKVSQLAPVAALLEDPAAVEAAEEVEPEALPKTRRRLA